MSQVMCEVALLNSRPRQQLPQDELKDPAMAVVIDFDWRIDPQTERDDFGLSVLAMDEHRHVLAGLNVV